MFIFNLTGFGSWIAFALAIWFFVAFFRNCNKDKDVAKRAEDEKKRREEAFRNSDKFLEEVRRDMEEIDRFCKEYEAMREAEGKNNDFVSNS